MLVEIRPAMRAALSKPVTTGRRLDWLMKGLATATAVLTAAVAVVLVAVSAVVLGLS
jgi:hypothetical protein